MLDPEQRRTFAALADVLIPASEPMPSATAAGVPEALIDQALGYRPDLTEAFVGAVASCADQEPEAALDELAARGPGQFQALTLLTAGAYFLSPQVNSALAHDPPPRAANDDTDTYVDMLVDVVERGFPTSRA
ncbi:gluconate 2-dehydrogenase subunit 3 family protein [Saccharopolyspora sp. NPDC003752]